MREGWEIKKLKEVCYNISDGTHQTPKYFDEGVIFLSSRNVTSGKINWDKIKYIDETQHIEMHKRIAPRLGDILLAKNGTTGVAAMVDRDVVFDIYVSLAHIRSLGAILPEYMLYFINSPKAKSQFNKRLKGIGVPNLHLKEIREVEITYPTSQEEQTQIVAILDQAFEAIDQAKANIEKNIENAKELLQSKLNDIFSQKGEGWEEKTLGELGKVSMCKRILKKQTTPDGDIPFYKIGTFGKKANAFIPKEVYDDFISKYSFPKIGDILISASGTIGRRVIYDGLPAYFQDSNIVWIDNNEELVTNEYLYQFYGVCDWNPSKGATISRLYNSDLRRIKISFPSITEQKQIVPKMIELGKQTVQIESNYKQKLEDLDEFKKSILQKAFAGELTNKTVEV
jgi:type I restriction enzyme S subunit